MTLDEAIKHAEEVAEKQENNAKSYPRPDRSVRGSGKKYNACLKCAEEHHQLAEWLKDYKRLLEQGPCDDAISRQAALRQAINAYKMAQENGFDFKDICEEYLNVLPPVTPQPCEDIISRECNNCAYYVNGANDEACDGCFADEYEHPNFKPKAQHCDNCISRQAVLDAMRKNHRSRGRDIDGDYIEGNYSECLYDDIISLSPVTPPEGFPCDDFLSKEERLKMLMETGEFDFLKDISPDKIWKLVFMLEFIDSTEREE